MWLIRARQARFNIELVFFIRILIILSQFVAVLLGEVFRLRSAWPSE